ncbi:MAG TPA: tyrosine-type recombinase/integrase [Dehalococcoidia bacterium]|jgi:integrase/recombinase XerC/integrase/recombinase XerD|nr:tyrosine-type recombinase/integrase [Dehalococcoidia bacterium]
MVATRARNPRWEELEKDSIELSVLARHFELYNRTEGKSPKTVDWYNQALEQFHRFLVEGKKSTRLGKLGEAEVREYILFLQDKRKWQDNPYVSNHKGKLAAISIQTYIRALRAFFNWLYKEGYTSENRLARLRPPKAPTKVVEVLSEEEITRVLNSIDRNTASGARDYAILMLLLDTGLRCSELRGIELGDINMEGGYLKIMGKGGKERIVPFGASAQKALLRYLLHFRSQPFNLSIQNLFLTLDGKPLTKNCVRMICRRIAAKSGVKRLYPHLCRHTFATNYLINGGDVFSLQQILGHTTLEMVRRYVTLASAHVTVQHRKFSPMDRINLAGIGAAVCKPNNRCDRNRLGSVISQR